MAVLDKKSFILNIVVIVAVVILLNIISRNWFFRFDLTDTQMYSLSKSSQSVIKKTDDLLTMKVFFTDNLPGQYANNRRYLQDILEEYAAYSDGNIRFEFFHSENEEKLGEEAQKAGIMPVQLQVIENDNMEIKRVYMGLQLIYEDKRETIPVIQTTTGLEYEITTKIKKLVDKDKPSIAFASFEGQELNHEKLGQLLRESYQIRNVDLKKEVPNDISVLLIGNVKDSVSQTELDQLSAFLERGGNLFVAQSRVTANLQAQTGATIASNFFDFLKPLNLNLKENLVMDKKSSQVTVSQNRGFFQMNTAMDYPFFPMINSFEDHLIVESLEQVRLLFTSEISKSDSSSPYNIIPLFKTSNRSGLMSNQFNLNPIQNHEFQNLSQPGKLVAALSISDTESGGVSQVILVGDSQFLDDAGSGGIPENSIFILNAVDYLMGDSELISLRSREITTRPLEEISDESKSRTKWLNILLPPFLIVALGLYRWKSEKKRSERIEELYG